MNSELNPAAVDDVMSRHLCSSKVTDSEIAQIAYSPERIPVSDAFMRETIYRLVNNRLNARDTTVHEACQKVALKTNRTYEYVRGHYDAESDLERSKRSIAKREASARHTCPACDAAIDLVLR